MTDEASNNDHSMECRRADLEARIARVRDALNQTDQLERAAAQIVATLRACSTGNGPRSARKKAARNAQRIDATISRDVAAVRTPAKAALKHLQAQLDALPGSETL